jgi:hypothetical protein
MRGASLASAVGMALVLAACVTRVEEPSAGPGVPPERVGATGARCPDDHPIPVLGGVAFPAGHPDAPVVEPRPDRCFHSLQEAERAGYPIAEPPPGSRLIGDIYVGPVEGGLRADCRRAARSIDRPVACPTLLPSGGSLLLSIDRGSAVFEGGFPLPEGHDPEAESHLWVVTTRPALAGQLEVAAWSSRRCPRRSAADRRRSSRAARRRNATAVT